jgi:prepilin-type N-terminal cleavage/methylation domain-containing protein
MKNGSVNKAVIIRHSSLAAPHSKGFTLLEVMVAVTIMSMVLVTLIGLKNSSMQDVALAEHITTATMLAKGKMLETIKTGKLDSVEEDGEYPAQENLMEYTWKRTISKIPVPNGQYLTEIRVATLWNEGTRPEIVELVDYE